jgi:hypothetical protein
MARNDDGRRAPSPRVAAAVVAVVLAVTGIGVAAVATAGQQNPPSPRAAVVGGQPSTPWTSRSPTAPSTGSTTGAKPTPTTTVEEPVLSKSIPAALTVPRIGVHSAKLVHLGLAADGSITVPPTGRNSPASWFTGSPTPGELGPAVILGHVDSAEAGPAIFYRLGAMRPGDTATVRRVDGTDAVFTVDKVEEYTKAEFPTLRVFGNTDRAELRLITCGGHFDPRKHSYEDNIVVFAHLTSAHRAPA